MFGAAGYDVSQANIPPPIQLEVDRPPPKPPDCVLQNDLRCVVQVKVFVKLVEILVEIWSAMQARVLVGNRYGKVEAIIATDRPPPKPPDIMLYTEAGCAGNVFTSSFPPRRG